MKFIRKKLENERFGKLLVLSYDKNKKYICLCDCGNKTSVYSFCLVKGQTKSCGCQRFVERDSYDNELKEKLINFSDKNESGCWIWKRAKNKQGYGSIAYKRKSFLAHRLSFMLFKEKVENDFLILHKCDNPSCVNPNHLFKGTSKDNFLDCKIKGRLNRKSRKGEKTCKLDEEKVKQIRDLSKNGLSQDNISKNFNVSRRHIGAVINHQVWKNVK